MKLAKRAIIKNIKDEFFSHEDYILEILESDERFTEFLETYKPEPGNTIKSLWKSVKHIYSREDLTRTFFEGIGGDTYQISKIKD